MGFLLHEFIKDSAALTPEATALLFKKTTLNYRDLWDQVNRAGQAFRQRNITRDQRVAVYLPKQPEAVTSFFGCSAAGGVFIPVNPVLKAEQVGYILRDCNARVLVTSVDRALMLHETLEECSDLEHLVLIGDAAKVANRFPLPVTSWGNFIATDPSGQSIQRIDSDMASILYTSGSTGQPKGVVLSHYNMVAGARSVAQYLENTPVDRLLTVLPFSFDYGLSQLTTAFSVGASVVLMDYLLPRDVIRAISKFEVTGLAAVPPLWNQLADLDWPAESRSLRYITNSGGAMPVATTQALKSALPDTSIYLMYGLTEAFRSTYLPPDQVDIRPESMGKAIPNAEVMIVRPDGSECDIDEAGELVHRGALVALGYWNDAEKTAVRFKPSPGTPAGIVNPELAVWSGDQARRDADGYLYFIGRNDEMIKTSGYRVSPSEIEEIVFQLDGVSQAVALGIAHPAIGQGIVLIAQVNNEACAIEEIQAHCRHHLPMYMLPGKIIIEAALPRNANGKIDRKLLSTMHQDTFQNE